MTKEKKLEERGQIKYFWLIAVLVAGIMAFNLCRGLTRPFNGMHSWAQASGAWAARTHVKYGLGYTKGISTWAVGDPPTEEPNRYLDHPQLAGLVSAGIMKVLGIHEWTFRSVNVVLSILTTLIFIRILRGLVGDPAALVSGVIFAMFPLHSYFGTGGMGALIGLLRDVVLPCNHWQAEQCA